MNKKALKTGAILVTLGSISAFVSCSKQDASQQMAAMMNQAPAIEVMTVEPTSADINTSYPATIKGKTDIDIRPQVQANIVKVLVDEGQRVKKGQTLFLLDDIQLNAAVAAAQAAVNSAQAAVNTAATNEKNQKALFEKNIISQAQWQTSADQLAQANAGLRQAKENLVNAKKNLSYASVTAPSDGVIGSINFREGSLASPSTTLTTVSDNTQVYANFSLNEKDLLALTGHGEKSMDAVINGLPEITFQMADGSTFANKGRIATIDGVIDRSTGAANVRALFSNPEGLLRSGSSGQIIIPTHYDSIVIIPQKATYELQDRKFVYTVNDSAKTVASPVTVRDANDGIHYIVVDGLKKGDVIAVEGVGSSLTRPGTAIKPVTAEEKAQLAAQMAAQMEAQAKK